MLLINCGIDIGYICHNNFVVGNSYLSSNAVAANIIV